MKGSQQGDPDPLYEAGSTCERGDALRRIGMLREKTSRKNRS
jgi:hypothetical protein